jgi:hypothetical protein
VRLAFYVAVAIMLPDGVWAQEPIPVPLSPRWSDCNKIFVEHGKKVSPLSSQELRCISGPPRFGYCDADCVPGLRHTAYRQCCSIRVAICAVDQAYSAAYELCRQRAEATSKAEADQGRGDEDQDKRKLAQRLRAGNDAYDAVIKSLESLSSPEEFFSAALGGDSSLYGQLFNDKGQLTNPDFGEELMRYAFNQSKAGVRAQAGVTNELALTVQSKLLDVIERHYRDAMQELDASFSAFQRMTRLDSNLQHSLDNFHPQTLPARFSPSARDCAVLRDVDGASRKLLEEDSEQWLALSALCTK